MKANICSFLWPKTTLNKSREVLTTLMPHSSHNFKVYKSNFSDAIFYRWPKWTQTMQTIWGETESLSLRVCAAQVGGLFLSFNAKFCLSERRNTFTVWNSSKNVFPPSWSRFAQGCFNGEKIVYLISTIMPPVKDISACMLCCCNL